MVALEPGKPLLLDIMATFKVMSMVLVVEELKAQQPQAPKGAPIVNYGSQDPNPVARPRDEEVAGSQLSKPAPSLEPQVGSQLPKPAPSPKPQVGS
jgi:hypothetical protein